MGLTSQSTGLSLLKSKFDITLEDDNQIVVGLAGNPNTGKSTIFNALTGLNQHTGNWPGKTVENAKGTFKYKDKEYLLVDLPGTYSILANSVEEEIARDFICFGNPKITIVVTDATCLERNLNLVLQVMEITDNVIVCLNLMDEAERKGIKIDLEKLEKMLGVPVIPTVARDGKGLDNLKETIDSIVDERTILKPFRLKYDNSIEDLVNDIEKELQKHIENYLNLRWIALRLIDGDKNIINTLEKLINDNMFKASGGAINE